MNDTLNGRTSQILGREQGKGEKTFVVTLGIQLYVFYWGKHNLFKITKPQRTTFQTTQRHTLAG